MIVGKIKNKNVIMSKFCEVYELENLIRGPSFEQDGVWGGIVYDTSQHLFGSRSSKIPANTTTINTVSMVSPIVGHKYYGRHSIKTLGNATPSDNRFEWFSGDGVGLNFIFGRNGGNHPEWYTESSIIDISQVNGSSYICRNFAVSSNVDIFCDGLMIIDLTASFGVGYEPDKEWCDKFIPFFEGKIEFDEFPPTLNEKGFYSSLKEVENSNISIIGKETISNLFQECIVLKNLVTGGDMSGSSWILKTSVTYDTSRFKYGTQSMKIIAPSSVPEVTVDNNVSIYLMNTHIYYGRFEGYQEVNIGGCNIYWPVAEPSFGGHNNEMAGYWQKYSWVVQRTNFSNGNHTFRVDFDNRNVDGIMWIDGVMIIDLTASFGVGNEPSKSWCDENISFFNGTLIKNLEGDLWQF